MFVIKMKIQDRDNRNIEWYLQGLDSRPLRFETYGVAEREAFYQNQKNSTVDGFSCVVLEE